MNKVVAAIGSVNIFISMVLPWYFFYSPIASLNISLVDLSKLMDGIGYGSINIKLPGQFVACIYLVGAAGVIGIISAAIGKGWLAIVGGLMNIIGVIIFAAGLMSLPQGGNALGGSINLLGTTLSWGLGMGFFLSFIGGLILLAGGSSSSTKSTYS